MTNEEALKSFKNLYENIDKENHLFVGTINPEFIMMAIKALEQQQGWIPMSEQYPIIEQNVLVSKGDFVLIDTFCYDSIDETYYFDNYDDVEAWMPLPTPYKAERSDKE